MQRTESTLSQFIEPLIIWFRKNKKPLPWRSDPTPYHVWISEIMLQQTRIEAVIPYYHRFLASFPNVDALADASEDKLLKLWEGLGYYSRAKNLKKAAEIIRSQHHSTLPQTVDALSALPGIGDYTAGAITSIAYGQPEPAVDGNVLRVVMRLTARTDDISLPSVKKNVQELLRSVYPSGKDASDLTEALMELGETVCIPNGAPRCQDCPLSHLCEARSKGIADSLPVKAPKKARRVENRTILLLYCKGKIALNQRSKDGLLASLWEYPNFSEKLSHDEIERYLHIWGGNISACSPCGSTVHVFTHIEWHMQGFLISCPEIFGPFVWESPHIIREKYSIPKAFRFFQNQCDSLNP